MSRLFIIGNGFDIAHGYNTSYYDFKNWLTEELNKEQINDDPPILPEWRMDNHGEIVFENKELLRILMWILSRNDYEDPEWNKFEEYLYSINIKEVVDYWTPEYNDSYDRYDNELVRTEYRFEDNALDMQKVCEKLPDIFAEWVKGIPLPPKQIAFGKETILLGNGAVRNDDLFLTFNYTETLEDNYKVPPEQICHMHGFRKRYGERLVVGHGNKERRDFGDKHPNSSEILSEAIEELRKDVGSVIRQNGAFWNKLQNAKPVTEIYNFGHSVFEVDLPYYSKIMEVLDDTSNIKFYLNTYDASRHDDYICNLRKCGFEGTFNTY